MPLHLAPMKPRLTPTEINLKELPSEGREFVYTDKSEELNEALTDLIGKNPYEVSFTITPMGNTFDLKGSLKSGLDLQCSLCAIDFKFPVNLKLHELLVVQKPLNKGDQLTKNNHAHEWESQGPDYILLESDLFQVADYIHEAIALAEPIRPLGKPDCDLNCENMPETVKKYIAGEEATNPSIRTNPFQVLEKIKLKS
jgi:uncharacterized metal-binding protein YceD (DUF177 family)